MHNSNGFVGIIGDEENVIAVNPSPDCSDIDVEQDVAIANLPPEFFRQQTIFIGFRYPRFKPHDVWRIGHRLLFPAVLSAAFLLEDCDALFVGWLGEFAAPSAIVSDVFRPF